MPSPARSPGTGKCPAGSPSASAASAAETETPSATSRRSVGIAMAPAITLNRMYHCVPSSISRIEPTPSPPPMLDQRQQHHGKQRRGRHRRGHLRQRLRDARQLRVETDGHARRNGPQRRDQQRDDHAHEGRARALQRRHQLRAGQRPSASAPPGTAHNRSRRDQRRRPPPCPAPSSSAPAAALAHLR